MHGRPLPVTDPQAVGIVSGRSENPPGRKKIDADTIPNRLKPLIFKTRV